MNDDLAFANEIQKLATQGGFDPFSLLAGEKSFHSVFLAPPTPSFAEAVAQFLADGGGPLAGAVESLRRQGAPDPAAAARELFSRAQGLCVLVFAGDHGVDTIPHLFHGRLDDEWAGQVVASCGEGFPAGAAVRTALADLRRQAERGDGWPRLVAGPLAGKDRTAYWLELAAGLLTALDGGLMPMGRDRLADLAHWCSRAIVELAAGKAIEAEDVETLVRCQLLAGEIAAAGQGLAVLIGAGAVVEDGALELLNGFVDGALRAGQARPAAQWLAAHLGPFDQALGEAYEVALALFRLQVAAVVPTDEVLATAALLAKRNRKAMRQDLVREPIWAVPADLAGELVDTTAAADLIGRSPTFIAKRLDQGTIPLVRNNDQIRLSKPALVTWKAVMEAYQLLG